MMKFKNALLLATSFALVGGASAQSPLEIAKKLSKEFRTAMMTQNIAFFEKGSTPDFVYIDIKGRKAPKAQSIAGIKGAFQATKQLKTFDVKVISAKKAEGGIVFVSDSRYVALMNMGGPKPSEMVSIGRDETLAVKKNGKWLFKRVKILKDNTKVDGKPMPGM